MRAPSRCLFSWISTTAALALLAAPGCSGTSVGNPPSAQVTKVKLGLVGTEDSGTVMQGLVGGLTLGEAWVSLSQIALRDAENCKPGNEGNGAEEGEFDVSSAFAADLLTGAVYPAAPEWERMSDESYCALQTSLGSSGEPVLGAPPELHGHSVYVRGTRADGTPFEITSDLDEALKVQARGKGQFSLGEGEVGLLLSFNLNAWLNPTLINEAQVEGGWIHADNSKNPALAETVNKQLPGSARLLRDRDRDGKLDPGDDELESSGDLDSDDDL